MERAVSAAADPKPLVFVRPDDDLAKVVGMLFQNKCSMAPIMSTDPQANEVTLHGVSHMRVGLDRLVIMQGGPNPALMLTKLRVVT